MKKAFIALFLFFWIPTAWSVNYITLCNIPGQFGSQLFSVAMTLGYGWEYGLAPVFSEQAFKNALAGQKNWDNLFYRLNQTPPKSVSGGDAYHVSYASLTPLSKIGGNLCFCGVRTEFWYFDRFKTEIKKLFRPSEEIKKQLFSRYSDIINHPKTVAVHLRTYHPIKTPAHLFLGKEYYAAAIRSFPEDHLFVIFSDRIDWCRDHLRDLNRNLVFIDTKDHLLDFYLMTLCKNLIVANSTYSWWAAYLRENEKGVVMAPDRWFMRAMNEPLSDVIVRKFYPSDWVILPVENDSPCYDLLDYETTSLDEQNVSLYD